MVNKMHFKIDFLSISHFGIKGIYFFILSIDNSIEKTLMQYNFYGDRKVLEKCFYV